MNNDASVQVTYDLSLKGLIKYAAPSALLYLFISLYGVVDSLLIDRFINETAIAAINIFLPINALFVGLGYMTGTGANAAIMKAQGEGNTSRAQNIYNQIITFSCVVSVVLPVLLFIFTSQVTRLLGATADNISYVNVYYRICLCFMPALLISSIMNLMLLGEGRVGTVVTLEISGGLTNCILDVIFMKYLDMGIEGAALGTGIGYVLQTAAVLIIIKRISIYKMRLCAVHIKDVGPVLFNGVSELLSSLFTGILTVILNNVAGYFWNSVGVSVVCVLSNISYMTSAVFMGIMVVLEPVIAYYYGQKNKKAVGKLLANGMTLMIIVSIILSVAVFALRSGISQAFFDKESEYFSIAVTALAFAGLSYLFSGFNNFVSGYFTALSNGKISGLFSFVRNLLIYSVSVLILTNVIGGIGMWAALVTSELLSVLIGVKLLQRYGKI
ncbi:MAG: hypothetical protein K6E49_10725 [Lachnospiraceae bacterium]|nr:hypothetical protein [Lachnospiraceae bacterium]